MDAFKVVFPKYATICLTSRCNAKCVHCSSGRISKLHEIPKEIVFSLLDDLNDCGVFQIGFSGGEPLMYPNIWEVLSVASKMNFKVGVGTNGYIISNSIAKKMQECGVNHVQISLDSLHENVHDSFRNLKGLSQKAKESIDILQSAGLLVNICMTPTRVNWTELSDMIDWCVSKGIHCFNLSQFVPIGNGNISLDLTPQEWRTVLEIWQKKRDDYEGAMLFSAHEAQLALVATDLFNKQHFDGCQAGRGVCCIRYDGSITPCVMMDVNCGNLYTESFKEVWGKSQVIRDLQNRLNIKGKCSSCSMLYQSGQ